MQRLRRSLFVVLLMLPSLAAAKPDLYLEPDQNTPVARVRLPEQAPDETVTMNAGEMAMDQENGIIIARGKVEVMQGDAILTADRITYYQKTDLVMAEGNVSMLQPSGDVYFAEKAELKDGMKRAVIEDFRARFADNSSLAANRAIKVNSALTTLKQASYTSCNLCESAPPFWQMNADDATMDTISERITYKDAFMEMFGVPMFYTPYLSHPTPDARAKSGLLTPSYGTNPYFGTVAKVPVYWRISEDKDVVLTPWLTTTEGPLLQWDYKQLRNAGDYHVQGSITNPRKIDDDGNHINGRELRGHIFAQGTESVGDKSNIGFDIQHATDDTYLRRYSFGGQQALFSSAYYEYADRRNFGLVNGLAIQGLRATDSGKTTPLVMPIFQGYYETPAYDNGMKLHVEGNAQALSREEGVSQRRVSITPGITLPMVTDGGQIFTATANMRQDIYNVENVQRSDGRSYDGTATRTLPQAALEWRYPLINGMESGTWLGEPIALTVLQPNGGNDGAISNEDSSLIELSDTNLFSLQRVPGLDLVDSGSRVAYGMRSQFYAADGMALDGLLGQNYNFNSDTPFPNSTNPGQQFSDYIGRIATYYDAYSLAYRFALDSQNLDLNRNEIVAGFRAPWLAFSGGYRTLNNNRYLQDSQETVASATLPLSDAWSLYGNAARDLELSQMVEANGGIIYKNECFTIMLDGLRTYARDRDIEPTTQFTFRVGFKNLGEFGGK